MTTLDLNAYGVTEMSHAEKVENNGGGIIGIALAIAGIAIYLYDNRESFSEGASEGKEAVSSALNG